MGHTIICLQGVLEYVRGYLSLVFPALFKFSSGFVISCCKEEEEGKTAAMSAFPCSEFNIV